MLFAELHGKLDPNAPDLERREDVLTSTTFGTLIVANATDVLVEWLNCARRFGARGRLDREPLGVVHERPVKYWFWPSLAGGTQPDVVLRIGDRLLVIEAKYGSAKGGAGTDIEGTAEPDSEAFVPDQLVREWQAIQPYISGLAWYPTELRDAIETCDRHLVYLVSARRTASALRELQDSQTKIRNATKEEVPLWLLTWQDLHGVLIRRSLNRQPDSPWVADLARLLDHRRQLAAFLGFAHVLEPLGSGSENLKRWAGEWSSEKFSEVFGLFRHLDLPQFHQAVSVVEAWAAERWHRQQRPYFDELRHFDHRGVQQLTEYLERQQIQWLLEASDD